jgi:hypothetical protein
VFGPDSNDMTLIHRTMFYDKHPWYSNATDTAVEASTMLRMLKMRMEQETSFADFYGLAEKDEGEGEGEGEGDLVSNHS